MNDNDVRPITIALTPHLERCADAFDAAEKALEDLSLPHRDQRERDRAQTRYACRMRAWKQSLEDLHTRRRELESEDSARRLEHEREVNANRLARHRTNTPNHTPIRSINADWNRWVRNDIIWESEDDY